MYSTIHALKTGLMRDIILSVTLVFCCNSNLLIAEEKNTGWSLYFDNDLFALGNNDSDYTGGFALKLSGTRVKTSTISVDKLLENLDDISVFKRLSKDEGSFSAHSMEVGLTLFTPKDLNLSTPIDNQHPYSSLFFINNTRMRVIPGRHITYQSSFTLGVLGLSIAENVQKTLHKVFGSKAPRGWKNQISSGGEPTIKYSMSKSKNHLVNHLRGGNIEIKTNIEANIGYSTDIGVSTSLRWGRIQTPWWSFSPHNAEYISLGSPGASFPDGKLKESYLWLGLGIKYRLYNALLQGQFRDSKVTFDKDELVQVIGELWLGYTHQFNQHWRLSAFFRARNQEIDISGLSDPMWGGFIISKSY
jgi:hypothetical protein